MSKFRFRYKIKGTSVSNGGSGMGQILEGVWHRVESQAQTKNAKIAEILSFLKDTKCSCNSENSISDGELDSQGGAYKHSFPKHPCFE